jgi:hypothetical protein
MPRMHWAVSYTDSSLPGGCRAYIFVRVRDVLSHERPGKTEKYRPDLSSERPPHITKSVTV